MTKEEKVERARAALKAVQDLKARVDVEMTKAIQAAEKRLREAEQERT